MVCGLCIVLVIFSLELTPLCFFANMLSFQRQVTRPPPRRSRAGSSRPTVPSSALIPATSPAPRSQQVQVSATGPSNSPKKKRRAVEIDLANPLAVSPESIIVATKGVAREALAEQVGLLRRTEIMAPQPGVLEGYTLDPERSEVVKQLPEYLQPVVTLMATMVPLTEESELREKRGWDALNQGTSMVLMVSVPFPPCFH